MRTQSSLVMGGGVIYSFSLHLLSLLLSLFFFSRTREADRIYFSNNRVLVLCRSYICFFLLFFSKNIQTYRHRFGIEQASKQEAHQTQ